METTTCLECESEFKIEEIFSDLIAIYCPYCGATTSQEETEDE